MLLLFIEDRDAVASCYAGKLLQSHVVCGIVPFSHPDLAGAVAEVDPDVVIVSPPSEGGAGRGAAFVRELRAAGSRIGIVAMQEGRDADAAVAYLDAGADDVVVNPIQPRHLAARARAILRRMHGAAGGRIQAGGLAVFSDGSPPTVDGRVLSLSKREAALLERLVLRAGKAVDKLDLYRKIYGGSSAVDPKIIDVYICKLRKKLVAACGRDPITTVFGTGYLLSDTGPEPF